VKHSRQELVDALEIVAESHGVPTAVAVEAQGLLIKVSKPEFVFMADVTVAVLSLLSPANAMLQGKRCTFSAATDLISSSREAIEALRTDDKYAEFAAEAGIPIRDAHPRRNRTQNRLLKDFLVSTTLGQQGPTGNITSQWGEWDQEKQAYFSLLDAVTGEMRIRFGETNLALFQSVEALLPSSEQFLKSQSVKPLAMLLELEQATLDAELAVVAAFFSKNLPKDSSLESATKAIVTYKDAFPSLYALYAGASTIGVSTATCENSFSALTRVLHPRRRSMTHQRKAQLVILAFEKQLTRAIDMDAFVTKFNCKTRRIILRTH